MWLHFHFSLSHNGEGNGNPLQCSCLENPRDGGAWWAAVCGVTQAAAQNETVTPLTKKNGESRLSVELAARPQTLVNFGEKF